MKDAIVYNIVTIIDMQLCITIINWKGNDLNLAKRNTSGRTRK